MTCSWIPAPSMLAHPAAPMWRSFSPCNAPAFVRNGSRHESEQKRYVVPPTSASQAGSSSLTAMPHTGSRCSAVMIGRPAAGSCMSSSSFNSRRGSRKCSRARSRPGSRACFYALHQQAAHPVRHLQRNPASVSGHHRRALPECFGYRRILVTSMPSPTSSWRSRTPFHDSRE
jgi:hypothetical protein